MHTIDTNISHRDIGGWYEMWIKATKRCISAGSIEHKNCGWTNDFLQRNISSYFTTVLIKMSAVQLHYLKNFVFSTDKEILRFPSHKIYCTLIYRKHNSLLFILRAISLLLTFCYGHWFVVNCELIWVCHWVNNLHLLHVLRML